MQISLSEMLQQPVEIDVVRRTESSALLRVTATIAIGAALLFGAGWMLSTTGPMTEFSQTAPEIAGGELQ